MPTRSYGQFCGFARALEVVGERWALLIVRDLLVSPKRFTDLHRGLPGIPTNVLTERLKELEEAGVVHRRVLPRPASSIVYELTPYGQELEDVVFAIGRWGAKKLDTPRPEETVTADSLITALRTTFRRENARGVHVGYELRLGPIVIHARVDGPKINVAPGPLPEADLIIEAGPGMKGLMTGELTAAEAIRNGTVKIKGKTALLEQFAKLFRIDPMPSQSISASKTA
jgi:DNA-binding HxlR family transcriptional regulator